MMDLEYATTEDMLLELKRRDVQFIFGGELSSNRQRGEIVYAYHGDSQQNLARLLRFVFDRLLEGRHDDCP